jgi:TonB family protein
MKIAFILIASFTGITGISQTVSFEKQALASVQRMPASSLDDKLPQRPFASWFNEIIGPKAGVVWQLSECGAQERRSSDVAPDLPACAEVIALTPEGSKVIIVISVGTFKKGLSGSPTFFRAVIELDDQLYLIDRLNDLAEKLRAPARPPVTLSASVGPEPTPVKLRSAIIPTLSPTESFSDVKPVRLPLIQGNQARIKPPFAHSFVLQTNPQPEVLTEIPSPPPPAATPAQLQKVAESLLQDRVIKSVKAVYPANAKRMNAYGQVEVQITISGEGKVTDARAISGHMALRSAAVEAARGWLFQPLVIDGTPITVESVLTFVFAGGGEREE